MTRLLLRLGLLSAPFVAWLVLCEMMAPHVSVHPLIERKANLLKHQKEIEVVVLGSSHAFNGVRADQLGVPGFNLAFPSQSHRYDAALMELFLPELPKLRLVILPVSYLSMEYQLEDGIEAWKSYHYHYYLGIRQADRQWATRARNFSFYFLKTDRFEGVVRGVPHAFAGYADEYGNYAPSNTHDPRATIDPTEEEFRHSALQRLDYHHRQMDPRQLDVNCRILDGLIDRLHRRSIRVALVMMPVTRAYRDGMRPESYQRTVAALGALATRQGVPFRNYTADARFGNADFLDADHLNPEGAIHFTGTLRDEIVLPELGRASNPPAR